ncbi:MAG: DUF86 domain-containing protein [Anaerolineae bacterium]
MRRDDAYLLDMLIAAQKARAFVEGMTWEDFTRSELHQNAVMRPLEIIGEAAARISQETRDAHPEIPWAQIIGMRNRLAHEYFRVNLSVVWQTLQRDLVELSALLEPLVPPEDRLEA